MTIKSGDQVPTFEARNTEDQIISSVSFDHGTYILFFYPKAFTSGCTIEAAAFSNAHQEFAAFNATVIGVSEDDQKTQCEFKEKHAPNIQFIADGKQLVDAFGLRRRLLPLNERKTFVIRDGMIKAVFHHELNMHGHVKDALEWLKKN